MDRKGILKWLKVFTLGFISLLLLEIVIYFSILVITINLDGEQIYFVELIFSSNYITFTDMLLYLLLIIISFFFLVFSFFLLRLSVKEMLENIKLSKMILMVGLFLLVGNFVKLEYLFMLSNARVTSGLSVTYSLINIIYNQSITPISAAIMWNFILITSSGLIISGLIFGGVGLQWFLQLEKDFNKNLNLIEKE